MVRGMRRLQLVCLGFVLACVAVACTPDASQISDDEASGVAVASAPQELTPALLAGCWAGNSCGKPTLVCKRPDEPRPCGAAGCVDWQFACSTDADCLEGYACTVCKAGDPAPCGFIPGRCNPRTCRADSDCGSANVACQAGSCVHRPCRTNRTCRGYCVAGACWNKPGWCHDTTLPPPP
jgi:hypothetical protein